MRKVKKVKKIQTVSETIDILCNKCGKTCSNSSRARISKDYNMPKEFSGALEIEVAGGYDSLIIGDMNAWRFSLCEFCLKNLVETFKIPHEIKDNDLGDFASAAEHKKRSERANKKNQQEWITLILEKDSSFKKKDLKTKTSKELYDVYHGLPKE